MEDKRAVEARERAEARCATDFDGAAAIAQALALIALYGRFHGWPPNEDDITRREDAQMYDSWHRLRIALRRAPMTVRAV